MRKTWTESDAQRLKALREQAGIAQAAFAKRHALSVAQVRELEGGKTGSFYSEDIKAHTGRRLLTALGYVAPPPAEPEPTAAAAPTPPPEPLPSPQPEASIDAVPAPTPEPAPAAASDVRVLPAASESTPPPAPAARRSTGPLVGIAAVAVIAVAVFLITRAPGGVTVSTVTVPVNVAPVAPPPEAPAPAPAADASGPAAAASDAMSVAGAGTNKPALPAGCEAPGAREATQYQSPVADRPATYVHVEAMQAARVCVLDSQNQVRALVLKVGESVNVTGVPPFTLRSAQWSDLKVFFQGLRVQVEPGAASDNIVIVPKRGG